MDVTQALQRYRDLPNDKQVVFLAELEYQLTIYARDAYEPGTDRVSKPDRMRCVNEIMHRILGQQSKLLSSDGNRYSDDVFIQMVFDMASSCHLERELTVGVTEAFGRCA